ncbi:MAG: type IV secretory system conjugative DNA transfer family protein [Flavobacteriales bacterium]|jgi:hypothetical protein|nr:type IV secretory system conjugative DNA transfer family protein [Flavobacteriales bacterium]
MNPILALARDQQEPLWNLDNPLLQIPEEGGKPPFTWTVRNAVEGVQIFGGIGSGKSSGSGRVLALKYLSHGMGGLVLCCKTDERQHWQEMCRLTGRTDDLIIVEPGQLSRFNMLEYISAEGEGSFAQNIVQVLKTVISASQEKSSGKQDDAFWETALDMVMFNIIDLCQLAYGKVTLQLLHDVAQSMPQNAEGQTTPPRSDKKDYSAYDRAFITAQQKVDRLVEEFRKGLPSDTLQRLTKGELAQQEDEAIPELRRMQQLDNFFFEVLNKLSGKTRSIIDFSFLGFLYGLLQDPCNTLLFRHASTFSPEDCYTKGKIILINLPVKKYHAVGRDCQIMFKYIWQRAMEARDIGSNGRPVFLWADEAQHFLHAYDAEYQATARSSRIATVYISQNLPNYHASMGGDRSAHRVKSFIGTLGTKIFHANADIETNAYASELIGEAFTEETQTGVAVAGGFSASENTSWVLRRMVRPEQFVGLKTGGPENDFKVVGYMHVQGKRFASGFNHHLVTFPQNYTPLKPSLT